MQGKTRFVRRCENEEMNRFIEILNLHKQTFPSMCFGSAIKNYGAIACFLYKQQLSPGFSRLVYLDTDAESNKAV